MLDGHSLPRTHHFLLLWQEDKIMEQIQPDLIEGSVNIDRRIYGISCIGWRFRTRHG